MFYLVLFDLYNESGCRGTQILLKSPTCVRRRTLIQKALLLPRWFVFSPPLPHIAAPFQKMVRACFHLHPWPLAPATCIGFHAFLPPFRFLLSFVYFISCLIPVIWVLSKTTYTLLLCLFARSGSASDSRMARLFFIPLSCVIPRLTGLLALNWMYLLHKSCI